MAQTIPRYPNALRTLIESNGYRFRELAKELHISERTLHDWAAGNRPIPHRERKLLAHLLSCTIEELAPLPASTGIVIPAMNTYQKPSEYLEQAESIINLAWEAWFASRPKPAIREITKLLPSLENVMHLAPTALSTLHATELIIRCHGLLGAIFLDALQHDSALYHYTHAHTYAESIRDTNLAATYLALIGDLLRRQDDKASALTHMELAREQALHADRATLGHILQLLAYTYGDTGNEGAFEQTISEATDLLAFAGEGRDATKKEFIPFEVYEIRGKANRDLGKPLQALPYLDLAEQSLNQAKSMTPRWYALLEISRGQAFCDANDIATGTDFLSKGFLLAHQCHSPHQMNRVRKHLRKLENGHFQSHPKVEDLKNLLYETYVLAESDTL